MAPRLGGLFATGALGPVYYAGQCILAKRAEEGLKELSVENLRGGVGRGVAQAAERVGVAPSDIEVLLPMTELGQVLARLAVSQPNVLEAWRLYAGGLGGLLSGVADLTVDGRAPDTALCVSRLAKKVQRDKPLAEPLQRLADDLFDWQDALHRCVALLDDTTALQKAYRRRRMRKIGGIAGAALVVVILVVAIVWNRVAHARVVAAIEQADPCAALELSDGDLDRVSAELKARARQSQATCKVTREAEAKRQEEERRREARELAAKQAQEALEAQCATLAANVEAGQLTSADEGIAKGAAPLLGRIAKGALDLTDFGPAEPDLGCKGTKGEARLAAAFRKAVLAKPWNVPKIESPSTTVREALAQGAADLPPKLKMMIATRAADVAKKALISGKPEQIAQALSLCETAKALGSAPVNPCDSLRALGSK